MGKYCTDCGKEMQNIKFERCIECYKKKRNIDQQKAKVKIIKEGEHFVMFKYKDKPIEFPLWLLGIIFLIGVAVGAWLW